jgi:hypothetical protein
MRLTGRVVRPGEVRAIIALDQTYLIARSET